MLYDWKKLNDLSSGKERVFTGKQGSKENYSVERCIPSLLRGVPRNTGGKGRGIDFSRGVRARQGRDTEKKGGRIDKRGQAREDQARNIPRPLGQQAVQRPTRSYLKIQPPFRRRVTALGRGKTPAIRFL